MPDTNWELTDESTTYTFDGVVAEPQTLTVGTEVTFTFLLDPNGASGGHLGVYDTFRAYDRHLTDRTVDYGTDYQGVPWYRVELNPNADVSTYLFNVSPGGDVRSSESFWGLLTSIEDDTTLVGGGERLAMTFFVLGMGTDYTSRADVQNALEADL